MDLLNSLYQATICFCGVIALTLYYITLWTRTSAKIRTAPVPAGAWPLIGHLPMLSEPRIPHITLGVLADKSGPALTLRLGLHKALVVSSQEVAKECFTTNDKAFATRSRLR
ncbi:Cytochrome p450 [Thalictrum thalictroides]|uniref:Cytochrome p450 n=1 Tax=Thalictrum thalictroides TaxID=46969 RepID=A0A7J6V0B2_THATH|nr:Cytochrome p450 [Thalictrum thalictroides]